ncbi:MAG: MBL fold metallo-hydrolase, partial [Sphingobacterium sp.]
MYILLAGLLVVSILIYFLSTSDQIGNVAHGERLKTMESKPTFKKGIFENIEYTPDLKEGESYFNVLQKFLFNKDKRNVPSMPLPVIKTDLKQIPIDQDVLVWFGHSSYFIQIHGKKILVDPVFSDHASPIPGSVKAFKMSNTYS